MILFVFPRETNKSNRVVSNVLTSCRTEICVRARHILSYLILFISIHFRHAWRFSRWNVSHKWTRCSANQNKSYEIIKSRECVNVVYVYSNKNDQSGAMIIENNEQEQMGRRNGKGDGYEFNEWVRRLIKRGVGEVSS